jgi:hypothetical protein
MSTNAARTLRLICVLLVVCSFGSAPAANKDRKAHKMLDRLLKIDGAGSGLDADTVRGLVPLVVVDANGAVVGVPVSYPDLDDNDRTGALYVARRIGDEPFVFHVGPKGFSQTLAGPFEAFVYEESDCSGTAYMRVHGDSSMLPEFTDVRGMLAYYQDTSTVSVRMMEAYAVFTTDTSCAIPGRPEIPPGLFVPPDKCCWPGRAERLSAKALTLDLESLGLVPPFRLDVR